MKLWIAEKRDAGLKIAAAIGKGKVDGNSFAFDNGDRMVWASGHLLELIQPHDYNPAYKKWQIDALPIIPGKIRRRPRDNMAADRLKMMVRHIKQATCVVIATDPGREGEGIARQILDAAGYKGPVERLWTQSLAHDHLVTAVTELAPGADTEGLGVASNLRQSIDWIEGINHSRLYGIRYGHMGETISIGRVQSATLTLIVERDLLIENFKPEAYYDLKCDLQLPEGHLTLKHAPSEAKRIKDKAEAEDRKQRSEGKSAPLTVKRSPKNMRPPNPFSLPDLQITASSKWGWTAAHTLVVLQGLYEAGRVTYPRTDSAHLTNDMVNEVPALLKHLAKFPDYAKVVPKTPVIRKSVFDSSKTTDHHAIIPTGKDGSPSRGNADTEKLFDLIARRFLASVMEDATGETTSIVGKFGGIEYRASGLAIVIPGWKAVYEDSDRRKNDDEEERLPRIPDQKVVTLTPVEIVSRETKPPANYTDGTLVKAMVAVGADNPDAEIRDLMSTGIGTQATRHTIIETLKDRRFVVASGKKILSTIRGRELIGHMKREGNPLADPMMTADLEKMLKDIEENPTKALPLWRGFLAKVEGDFKRLKSLRWGNKLSLVAQDTIYNAHAKGGGKGPGPRSRPSNAGKSKRYPAKAAGGTAKSAQANAPRRSKA